MPSPNRHITIDDVDKRPALPSRSPHAIISGADFDRAVPPPLVAYLPWPAWVVAGVLIAGFGGVFVYWLIGALDRWAESSPFAEWLALFLPAAAVGVVGCVVVYWLAGKAYYSIMATRASAYQTLLTRMRLGTPAAADVVASMPVETLFLAEQQANTLELGRAPYTKYPVLASYNEGSHETSDVDIYGAGEESAPALLPDAGPVLDQLRKRYSRSAEHLFVGSVGETPVYLRWGNAGVSALIGGSGGGKTNTARLIAAWHALNGGGLAFCDGHGEVRDESLIDSCQALSGAYILPPAISDDDIYSVVRRMDAIGRARINGEPFDVPLLLVFDEFISVCRNHPRAGEIVNMLVNFGDEYRKVNMQVLLTVHHGRGDVIDKQLGNVLRATIGTRIVHNTDMGEAKFWLRPLEAQGVDRLRPGEALYFDKRSDVQKIVVPWLPPAALSEVGYPAHPGWPLSVETPGTSARDRRKAEVKAKIQALSYEQRLTELRKALALRGNTRTGYQHTTDYLREMFAIDQRVLIALSQEVRGGKTNGVAVE